MSLIALFLGLFFSAYSQKQASEDSQSVERTRLLLILDCSHSMWDQWQSDSKIKVTQKVLLKFIDSVASRNNIDVALRVFGHLNKDAFGTRLEVPFSDDNNYKIQSKIKTLVPNGGCTAASALTDALNDFPSSGSSRNIILIITDGMDDCDGNICTVARHVQLSGVIVQTFILGIGNPSDFQSSLSCAGQFTYLPNEEQYDEALYNIFTLSEMRSKVVVNLCDAAGVPYETDVPVVFYDNQTHVAKYHTIYSMDSRNVPDTLEIDPLVDYDVTLFTQPPLVLKNLHFAPDSLVRLNVEIEQGGLRVRSEQYRVNWTVPNYKMLIRQHGSNEILTTQDLGAQQYYRAGFYDIDILTTPVLHLNGVEIRGGANTDLSIPMSGLLNLTKPKSICVGSVFKFDNGQLTWVCDLNPNSMSERLLLLPGEYQLVIKPQGEVSYDAAQVRRFRIKAAQQTNVFFQ